MIRLPWQANDGVHVYVKVKLHIVLHDTIPTSYMYMYM